jgi:hypothetical protein
MMKRMSHPSVRILCATAAAWSLAFASLPAASQPPPPSTRTTVVKGVTVKISPRTVAADLEIWVFSVVLDTHSQDLADDLTKTVVLLTDDGQQSQPLSWKGPGAGGHHREGVLEFVAPKPYPKAIELKMQRPGEADARSFRWTF